MELDFKINLPKTQLTNPKPLKLSFILDFNNVDNKMTYTISQNKAGQINPINNQELEQRNEIIYLNKDNINNNNSINMTNIYSESNDNMNELDKKDFDNKILFTNNNNNNNEKQKNDNSMRDISKSLKLNKDLEAGEVIDIVNRNQKEKKNINITRENNNMSRRNINNNNNYNRNNSRRTFERGNNQFGKYEKLFLKDNDKDKDKEKFNYKKQIENIQIPENASDELFVSGLSENTNKFDFRKLFYKYGKVVFYRIIKDKKTQKNKGIGFIKFEDVKSAVYAMNCKDEIICDGKKLNIKFNNRHSINNNNNSEEKFKRNLLEKNLSKINESINLSNNSVNNERVDEEDSWGVGSNYNNDLERSRNSSLNRSQNRSKSGSRSHSRSKSKSLIDKKDDDNNNNNNKNNDNQW